MTQNLATNVCHGKIRHNALWNGFNWMSTDIYSVIAGIAFWFIAFRKVGSPLRLQLKLNHFAVTLVCFSNFIIFIIVFHFIVHVICVASHCVAFLNVKGLVCHKLWFCKLWFCGRRWLFGCNDNNCHKYCNNFVGLSFCSGNFPLTQKIAICLRFVVSLLVSCSTFSRVGRSSKQINCWQVVRNSVLFQHFVSKKSKVLSL